MTALAEARYANLPLYSETEPYEIVRVLSATTVEIRRMTAVLDPAFKPEMVVGGFAAHCTNQNSQKWIYSSDESAPVIKMRAVKRTQRNRMMAWKSAMGCHVLSLNPFKFYDYNF